MMVAYRLLIEDEEYRLPFTLGRNRNGEGEDGRIKSAVGIGTS